jgi:MSHA biogenesis protein MshJ
MEALKQRWQIWALRIDSLSFRERLLIFLAVVAATFSLMLGGLIEPALKEQEQMLLNVSTLHQQIVALKAQLFEAGQKSNSGKNTGLNRLRAEAAALEQTVKGHGGGMVPPEKMIDTLKSLLAAQPGLMLISLHTSAPSPIFKEDVNETAGAATPQTTAVPPGDQLYKHGFELRVQGSYADLTEYVRHLESLPWAMLWEDLSLDASHHPKIEMTLKLNTLSREPTWARF